MKELLQMKLPNARFRVLTVLIATFASMGGCANHESPAIAPPPVGPPPPVRIVVFLDKTRSMREARIGHVSIESFAALFERLQSSGGEVALGIVCDHSDAPLVRIAIPEPPTAPRATETPRNVFLAAGSKHTDERTAAQYATELAAWREDAAARVAFFKRAIEPLFAAGDDAATTDIHSALVRAELFIAEPTTYRHAPVNAMVFVSDGVESINSGQRVSPSSGAAVIVVNGNGSEGVLREVNPLCFEALEAALRYVAIQGGRHASHA